MINAFKEALAKMYVINGHYEKALAFKADNTIQDIFYFIEKHDLPDVIRDKVVQLMMTDSKRAISLFIQNMNLLPASEVVSQLINTKDKCDSRFFLHMYLHSLFQVNPDAGRDYHDMQVELYADYDAKMLLPFLCSSEHYTIEKAFEICKERDLLREQIFILERMGDAKQALGVIVNKLKNIEEAVEFVRMQHDDELWEELVKQCLDKPAMLGALLENTAVNIDPLLIVQMLPEGLQIPRLRDLLIKIMTDYKTETCLRHGCIDILEADKMNLLIKSFKEARRGMCYSIEENEEHPRKDKSKTRGGGKCCLCFDPFLVQDGNVVVFFCSHGYHETCLLASMASTMSTKTSCREKKLAYYEYENRDAEEEDESSHSDAQKMRCIMCATAAA